MREQQVPEKVKRRLTQCEQRCYVHYMQSVYPLCQRHRCGRVLGAKYTRNRES